MVLLGHLRTDPIMSFIDLIEHTECFANRGPDRVASVDELPVVTDVLVEIIKQFLRNLDADLRHTLVFVEKYLQRDANHTGLARSSLLQGGAPVWVAWVCGSPTQRSPFIREQSVQTVKLRKCKEKALCFSARMNPTNSTPITPNAPTEYIT